MLCTLNAPLVHIILTIGRYDASDVPSLPLFKKATWVIIRRCAVAPSAYRPAVTAELACLASKGQARLAPPRGTCAAIPFFVKCI